MNILAPTWRDPNKVHFTGLESWSQKNAQSQTNQNFLVKQSNTIDWGMETVFLWNFCVDREDGSSILDPKIVAYLSNSTSSWHARQ